RQGMNHPYFCDTYHGMAPVTRSEELRKNHPEYYALYNGVRSTEGKTPESCLSSEGLFEEHVKYIRMMFDMYDMPYLSVWPDDGFTAICQCDKCKGKDSPDRGRQGILSNYVWDYVNKIGKEIAKTHPGKMIVGGAYSTYFLPPNNIEKLNPNIMVHIVNARRRTKLTEAEAEERRAVVKEWARLTDNKVIAFNNVGGANTPNVFAEDIKGIKDYIIGEDMWINSGSLEQPGFMHLNYYVCARMWWNPDLDPDNLLNEYYKTFYGPVADEMKAFINYYEAEQGNMKSISSAPVIKKALDLFDKTVSKVNPDSVYGKRVALFGEGLESNRKFYDIVKDGRDNPPVFKIIKVDSEIKLDGKLDEDFWKEFPGELKGLADGEDIKYPAKFKMGLKDNDLYVGIKLMDEKGNPVNISQSKPLDDSVLWYGDAVEILLETPMNSYYQIAINPEGSICDLDRSTNKNDWFNWDSEADVKTYINKEEGYWTIEARIPFTPSTQDPLHEIIGSTPSEEKPWFFNICRQRIREDGNESSTFSPVGKKSGGSRNFMAFGKLIVK
ncbi:MAG: DUF4838 domain-containing protein, partial [Lentisphaerae bacterium]|nr:DUF4838 domain-containing protein [Lentisphaerota bacterium]